VGFPIFGASGAIVFGVLTPCSSSGPIGSPRPRSAHGDRRNRSWRGREERSDDERHQAQLDGRTRCGARGALRVRRDLVAGCVAIAGVGGAVLIAISLLDLGLPQWGREAMILVGALPLAALTWWSLVTPLIAALVIAIGSVAARRRAANTSPLQADNGTVARG
jgi:hypothetical protein